MAVLEQTNSTIVPREALQAAFPGDVRLQLAVEQALRTAQETPPAVNAFADSPMLLTAPGSDLLENARVLVAGLGVALDFSTPGALIINVHVSIDRTTRITGLLKGDDDAAVISQGAEVGEPYFNGSVLQVVQP